MTSISFCQRYCCIQSWRFIKIYQEILLEDDSTTGFFIKRQGLSGLRCHRLWALQAPISLKNSCGLNMMVEQRNRGRTCENRIIHHYSYKLLSRNFQKRWCFHDIVFCMLVLPLVLGFEGVKWYNWWWILRWKQFFGSIIPMENCIKWGDSKVPHNLYFSQKNHTHTKGPWWAPSLIWLPMATT